MNANSLNSVNYHQSITIISSSSHYQHDSIITVMCYHEPIQVHKCNQYAALQCDYAMHSMHPLLQTIWGDIWKHTQWEKVEWALLSEPCNARASFSFHWSTDLPTLHPLIKLLIDGDYCRPYMAVTEGSPTKAVAFQQFPRFRKIRKICPPKNFRC